MFDHEERFCLLAYVVEMVRVVGLWAVVKHKSIIYKGAKGVKMALSVIETITK